MQELMEYLNLVIDDIDETLLSTSTAFDNDEPLDMMTMMTSHILYLEEMIFLRLLNLMMNTMININSVLQDMESILIKI